MKRKILLVILLLLSYQINDAQIIVLDSTFKNDGISTIDFSLSSDDGYAAALQSDDKIIVGGRTKVGNLFHFASARYQANGEIDSTYNGNGKVITAVGQNGDECYATLVMGNGKIVLGGASKAGNNYAYTLIRYNSDGQIDSSFSQDGIQTNTLGVSYTSIFAMKELEDGKLIVAGQKFVSNTNFDIFLAKYLYNGELDTTFNHNGVFIPNLSNYSDGALGITIQPDAKILIAGYSDSNAVRRLALVRVLANGGLDSTFNGDGIATTTLATQATGATSLTLQPDGKILVVGIKEENNLSDFLVARYLTNGSLDPSFNTTGYTTLHIGSDNIANTVKFLANGKVLISGTVDGYFAMARYLSNGKIDSSFNLTGIVTTPAISSSNYIKNQLLIQSDGKLIQASTHFTGVNNDFVAVRYRDYVPLQIGSVVPIVNDVFIIPNPIVNNAELWYTLLKQERIQVSIYDIQGRKMKELLSDKVQQAGNHRVLIHQGLAALSEGNYIIKLRAGNTSRSILIRKD